MITIIEPSNPECVATATRERLQTLVQNAALLDSGEVRPSLSKEEIKTIKDEARHMLFTKPVSSLGDLAIRIRTAIAWYGLNVDYELHHVCDLNPDKLERLTYVLECAVSEAKRIMHTQELQAHTDLHWVDVWEVPRNTRVETDREARVLVKEITGYTYLGFSVNEVARSGEREWNLPAGEPGSQFLIAYADGDVPMVAGVLNMDDPKKIKFIRQRLGAYLSSLGRGDDYVREAVESAKKRFATGDFIVYPNDVLWAPVYTDVCAEGSCMSRPSDCYDGSDHPVNAYSSMAYNTGDNGLALVLSSDCTSRGILNTHTWEYVRWYGKHQHSVALDALGCSQDDHALRDTFLALIIDTNDDEFFIAPYVDGAADEGRVEVDEERVYLETNGDISLSDTDGVYRCSKLEQQVLCHIDDEYYPRSHCTYVEGDDVWVHDSHYSDLRYCYFSGQYYLRESSVYIKLDGRSHVVGNEALDERIGNGFVWVDGLGAHWSADVAKVDTHNGTYREIDCRQKKDGSWILHDEYNADEDETSEPTSDAAEPVVIAASPRRGE